LQAQGGIYDSKFVPHLVVEPESRRSSPLNCVGGSLYYHPKAFFFGLFSRLCKSLFYIRKKHPDLVLFAKSPVFMPVQLLRVLEV